LNRCPEHSVLKASRETRLQLIPTLKKIF